MVARGLAHHVHRGAFALGNLLHMFDGLLFDEQAHALLTLVGDDLLSREGLVADRQLAHVNQSATLLYQLAQTVYVACRAVVVDGDYGVALLFAEGAHHVVGTLLHLRIGALHGVQLNAAAVATGVNRRYRATAQADAVVVTAQYHHLFASLGCALQAVAARAVAHATGQHDDFIVAIKRFIGVLLVLEGEHRATDQRLAELVAEVAGTVRGLDQNLLRGLVEPFAHGQQLLPFTPFVGAGVGGHIDRCAGDGP